MNIISLDRVSTEPTGSSIIGLMLTPMQEGNTTTFQEMQEEVTLMRRAFDSEVINLRQAFSEEKQLMRQTFADELKTLNENAYKVIMSETVKGLEQLERGANKASAEFEAKFAAEFAKEMTRQTTASSVGAAMRKAQKFSSFKDMGNYVDVENKS